MLDHSCQRKGDDGKYRRPEHSGVNIHIKQVEHAVVPNDGKSDPLCLGNLGDYGLSCSGVNDDCQKVRADNAEEDGDDLCHALAPDVEADDDDYCRNCNKPVDGAVVNCRAGEDKTDGDDDGTGNNRREEAHDLVDAEGLEQCRQDNIHQSGAGNAKAGIHQKIIIVDGLTGSIYADGADGVVAADKGEGRAEECRDLAAGYEVEQQCAEACEQQCRCNVKSGEHGDENGCTEHCEHMLQSQNQHSGLAEGACVIHGSINHGFFFHLVIVPLFV